MGGIFESPPDSDASKKVRKQASLAERVCDSGPVLPRGYTPSESDALENSAIPAQSCREMLRFWLSLAERFFAVGIRRGLESAFPAQSCRETMRF